MTWLIRLFHRCDPFTALAAHTRRMRALADINAHIKETRP